MPTVDDATFILPFPLSAIQGDAGSSRGAQSRVSATVLVRGSIARVGVVERCDAGSMLSLASLSPRGHGLEKVEEVEDGADGFRWWPRGFHQWLGGCGSPGGE
jgi:hypothetical protein